MPITANQITARVIQANPIAAIPIQGGGGGEVCRNVSNFNGVDSYAEFDNDIVLIGDFKVEITYKWYDYDTTGEQALISDLANTCFFMLKGSNNINPNDFLFRAQPSPDVDFTNALDGAGNLTKLIFERSGTDAILTLPSGQTILTTVVNDFTIRRIGIRATSLARFNGQIMDIIIEDNGVIVTDLPMNEGTAGETGTVNYINRTGNTDYNATGFNIEVTEECECPLTFENGILNGGRVLCSGQLLIGSSDGTPYVDSEDWIDPENWND